MLRIWICLLALMSASSWAMEVSPLFSRQLAPVLKLYQSGQFQQAQSRARELKPGSESERAWLAQLNASLAANLQQTAQASRHVEQALSYKEWPEAQLLQLLRLKGDIQAQQSDWRGAISSYRAVLAKQPSNELRLRLAGLYYHDKQYDEAIRQSDQLLKQGWQKPVALIRLSALISLQRYAQAADQAGELIRREPNESRWWQQAVALNISAKRGDQALALLQTALDRGLMDEASTRTQLIRLYGWQGLPYRGARLLENAMAKGQLKQNVENQRLLAQLWEGAREWPKAIASWQTLARQAAQTDAGLRAAELLLLRGETEAAMTQLAATGQHRSEQGRRVKGQLVQALLNQQQYQKAMVLARELKAEGGSVWQERADRWLSYIDARQQESNKKSA
ncbi:hypothetical protein [Aeromonas bivalvium]|uniref:tetratricopeptide repeat protein n=1 Tax=Aeromonas bivalvium TaxID=440079 RepID=UPI0038D19EA4